MILYIDARTASIILNLHFVVSCFLSKYGILLVNFERHFINTSYECHTLYTYTQHAYNFFN